MIYVRGHRTNEMPTAWTAQLAVSFVHLLLSILVLDVGVAFFGFLSGLFLSYF